MRWEEVRERFPDEWVVLEAIKAHSAADTMSFTNKIPIVNTAFFTHLAPN